MLLDLGGIPREILGSAAAQPHQAAGEDVADLAEVGREMKVGRRRGHRDPLSSCPLSTDLRGVVLTASRGM